MLRPLPGIPAGGVFWSFHASLIDELENVARDHQVFIGFHHTHCHGSVAARYDAPILVVCGRIEANAEKFETLTDALPYLWCVLPYAVCKNEHIHTAEDCGKGAQDFFAW